MGIAALLSWIATALIGLYLLTVWLIENDADARGARASRLPSPVIFAHVTLALAGLGVWSAYLLSDRAALSWAALGLLLFIVSLGLVMFTRWIPVHRAFSDPDSLSAHARFDAPAERNFPLPVVVSHGIFAASTMLLVVIAVLAPS